MLLSFERSYLSGSASRACSTARKTVGTPCGEGYALLLEVLEEARGVEVGAWHHDLRPDEDGGEGQAPGVDVEHRDYRQHAIRLESANVLPIAAIMECNTVERCE
jgi:hypothetical protein